MDAARDRPAARAPPNAQARPAKLRTAPGRQADGGHDGQFLLRTAPLPTSAVARLYSKGYIGLHPVGAAAPPDGPSRPSYAHHEHCAKPS